MSAMRRAARAEKLDLEGINSEGKLGGELWSNTALSDRQILRILQLLDF